MNESRRVAGRYLCLNTRVLGLSHTENIDMLKPMNDPYSNIGVEVVCLMEILTTICPLNRQCQRGAIRQFV